MDDIYWGQYDRDESMQQAYRIMEHIQKDETYLRQTLRQMGQDTRRDEVWEKEEK